MRRLASRKRAARLACVLHSTPLPAYTAVLQHEAGAASLADTVAEIVRLAACVSADAHQVEGARAAASHHRGEQARITVTDHGTQARHGAGIHRQRLVATEAGGKLH